MTMNKILWKKKALKQLKKIPQVYRLAIVDSVEAELPDFSKSKQVKTLQNHHYQYRLRVGRYRVFFDHDQCVKIVHIEEVLKRDERTY